MTLAKQRAAIAMIPGKIGPKKKPTSALALKLMAMLPGKIATSSPQRLPEYAAKSDITVCPLHFVLI